MAEKEKVVEVKEDTKIQTQTKRARKPVETKILSVSGTVSERVWKKLSDGRKIQLNSIDGKIPTDLLEEYIDREDIRAELVIYKIT